MSTSKGERDRILQLVEAGQISATQAAELLDALDGDERPTRQSSRDRIIRVHATSLNPRKQKVHVVATVPVSLLRVGARLGKQLLPRLNNAHVEDLLRAIDKGNTGRLLELQDLEQGERLEIFVE